MEYQILLLPREDYWEWVAACREYALRYGVNLTRDPESAARYMAPAQVVTFPRAQGAFAEQGDLERWFFRNHPGIRLDPVEAQTPKELEVQLARRIAAEDRYGQKQKPFYLLWPTDYPVITQKFGANPQIYGRFGLPGHEGLDIRARKGTHIYCCAPGEVYRVHLDPRSHPYGIHVRVRHKDGYKSVYAHLDQALVQEGQVVEAGELIAWADSTGASTASHLHLTLKRDGATKRGETDYPKDILDPTPYIVWPETGLRKSLAEPNWAPGKCLIGVHGRVDGTLTEKDLEAIFAARVEAIKVNQKESSRTIQHMRARQANLLLAARLGLDFAGEQVTPEEFLHSVSDDVRRLSQAGIQFFEVLANPNLQTEGWQRSWRNGEEFARWFLAALKGLRELYPAGKFGFPGLAPGGFVSGWRGDADLFLAEAEEAAEQADWLGVHCYWTDSRSMHSHQGGMAFQKYRQRFPQKLLMITEFANVAAEVSPDEKASQYLSYYRALRTQPGVGAAFAFALSAHQAHESVVWIRDGAPSITDWVGARDSF